MQDGRGELAIRRFVVGQRHLDCHGMGDPYREVDVVTSLVETLVETLNVVTPLVETLVLGWDTPSTLVRLIFQRFPTSCAAYTLPLVLAVPVAVLLVSSTL